MEQQWTQPKVLVLNIDICDIAMVTKDLTYIES